MFPCVIDLHAHPWLSPSFFHQFSRPDSSALPSILVSSKFSGSFQRILSDVIVEGCPRAIFLSLIAPLPSTLSYWFVLAFFCVWIGVDNVTPFLLFSFHFIPVIFIRSTWSCASYMTSSSVMCAATCSVVNTDRGRTSILKGSTGLL